MNLVNVLVLAALSAVFLWAIWHTPNSPGDRGPPVRGRLRELAMRDRENPPDRAGWVLRDSRRDHDDRPPADQPRPPPAAD
jgi:hypothetical protein